MVDAGDIVRCTDFRMERITECGRTLKEQTVSKAKWRERWARWKAGDGEYRVRTERSLQ
ncbi:hypothetical protein C356_06182 [Cryptococcus neoformans c45]|nr:hypothetical protein C356_06182 [Cryptococcus neoformans var. grubii c45]